MFDLETFTIIHSVISLVALLTGLVSLCDLAAGHSPPRLGLSFVVTAMATGLSGFAFPFTHFLPSHAIGLMSLIALTTAIVARYRGRLAGVSSTLYAIGIAVSVYLLAFVALAQAFLKLPALHALAPTPNSPWSASLQALLLLVFLALGTAAVRRPRQVEMREY